MPKETLQQECVKKVAENFLSFWHRLPELLEDLRDAVYEEFDKNYTIKNGEVVPKTPENRCYLNSDWSCYKL